MGTDYYTTLCISPDAEKEEIKKAYRSLAITYHPDKNKNPGSEEKFKKVTEAYGVLIDPVKRKQYDSYLKKGRQDTFTQDFKYSPEDIIRDMLRNAEILHVLKEMEKMHGINLDPQFFSRFYKIKKGFIFGGAFYWGFFPLSILFPVIFALLRGQWPGLKVNRMGILSEIVQKIFSQRLIGNKKENEMKRDTAHVPHRKGKDIYYPVEIGKALAHKGGNITISVPYGKNRKLLRVGIPAGSVQGKMLRVKGKGIKNWWSKTSGDLYLTIHLL